jgi:Acetyltransferase (GNAT) domain
VEVAARIVMARQRTLDDLTGYCHPDYASSLAEFGRPLPLPLSGGWLLQRRIGSTEFFDAMGPYPMFCCRHWSRLDEDLSGLATKLVSVVLVADPFADESAGSLEGTFDDVVRFKDHYVAELSEPPDAFVRPSHQAHARRALRSLKVDVHERPWEHLDDWVRLYANLSRRHSISGLRAFSRAAFEKQLKTPGLVMFGATAGDEIVGLDLWFVQGDVAYGHLAAFSDLGYELRASYATKWTMLNYFLGRVSWVNLTGSSGISAGEMDGLAKFKSGWSTTTKAVYLCKRIFQPEIYGTLAGERRTSTEGYFPAYRSGEFG